MPVPIADVNVAALVAKCTPCSNVFAFAAPNQPLHAPSALMHEAPIPPRPTSMTVEGELIAAPIVADYRSYAMQGPQPVRIRYRWFQGTAFFLLFFAIAWNSFLFFWYSVGFAGNAPWIMFVFPLGHVAAGITVTKQALSGLFNRTIFDLDHERLLVTTGPFRWPWQKGSVSVPTAELRQLSVLVKTGSKGGRSFGVIAHLRDGSTKPLVEGLPDNIVASFFERAIERQLGLPDEPWQNVV